MSSPIDERIVAMKFNNGQFLTGVAATLNALAALKTSLNLKGAAKGVDQLGSSMSKLPPPQLAAGIQGLSAKFTALAAIGVTALANITNSAIAAGSQLVKSLTIDPIKAGLAEYETNLNAIQTIMANTGLEGDKGLGKVNKVLAELNAYSDDTIYNFSEMAKNIGTFTAAGVDLDTSANAIKGIANLAAVSGSNAQQASTAMYQLSQALSTGKLTLEDWNSVVNAGMGGKVFQDSLKETAKIHGVAVDSIIKEQGSFRASLQEGWITSEILTETLSKFTGDLTDAQLETMGYNEEQIKGIRKMGETATDAATKVKTMSQLIGTLQESAGSGWAKTWEAIFGEFDEAKELFTSVNDVLGGMIGESADARNKMIGDWKKLGGRTMIIESIGNIFTGLLEIMKPVQEAFRQIFPATTGKQLFALTQGLLKFSETIKIGAADAKNLKSTFAGVFALFSIAGQIISGLIGVVGRLFGVVGEGGSGFLDLTGNLGDFLVSVDEAMKKGEGLNRFFEGLGNVLEVPIRLIGALGAVIAAAFGGFDEGSTVGMDSALERIGTRLEPLSALGDLVAKAWGRMGDVLKGVMDFMAPFGSFVAETFSRLGSAISEAVSTGNFSVILDALNTGLFAVIALAIRKFLANGSIFDLGDAGGGFLEGIKDAFGGLTDTLGAMQASLKAGALIKIAGAVALLTASVVALSLIDSAKLAKALGALTIMFIQLGGAMAVFDAISGVGTTLKLAPLAAGLILLSTAILILSAAVKVLSTMSWEELGKGLTGVATLLISLAVAARIMSAGSTGLATASVGMIAMAVAVKILASAVGDFADMSWPDIGKGLAGVAGAMLLIAGAMRLMPANMALTGIGLGIVAASLVLLAGALKIMAGFSWEEIGKSMVVLAGSLAILAGAMYLMTAGLPGAAAMLVIAPALLIMAAALQIMATMSWEEIGKVMTILAAGLSILAITVTAMILALPGAVALVVIAGALAVLAPVLIALGSMSWEEIGKGLTVLAAALLIIGVAGAVLTPVIPTLLGLGVAIALMGVGMLAAGAGLLAFSVGLTALSVGGAAAVAAIIAIVSGLIGLIPMALKAVAEGLVLMAEVIGDAGPQMVVAMTTLMTSMLTATNNVAPKIIDTVWRLVLKLANKVADGYPKLVDAGLRLINGILDAFADNIGDVVTSATDVVVAFIKGLSNNLPRITEAGANMIITLVESLADSINRHAGRMQDAGRELAFAIVDGMTGGLLSGASDVIGAAVDMASNALESAKDVLGIASPSKEFRKIGAFAAQGFAKGLAGDRSEIKAAMTTMQQALADAVDITGDHVNEAAEDVRTLTAAYIESEKAVEEARKTLAKATGKDIAVAKKNLKDLTAEYRKNEEAVERAEDALTKSIKTRQDAIATSVRINKSLADEAAALDKLAWRYENTSKTLMKAREDLEAAKKTRDDFRDSTSDRFSDLSQVEGNTLEGFTTSFESLLKETNEFSRKLQQLRDLGLGDDVYKLLLQKGPDALPLINEIIAGGEGSVESLDKLASQLNASADKLGTSVSKELYQAGVDAATGIVLGLQDKQNELNKQMKAIAKQMVNALKKELGIKSPSKEFAKLGAFTIEGFVQGFQKMMPQADMAAKDVGANAIAALKNSLTNVGKAVNADLDMAPVIRPVLDLTAVKEEAKNMPLLNATAKMSVGTSYGSAAAIAAARNRATTQDPTTGVPPATPPAPVSFTQNNYSPEALSEVDIYRDTKNLLAASKGALKE